MAITTRRTLRLTKAPIFSSLLVLLCQFSGNLLKFLTDLPLGRVSLSH